MRKIMHVAFEGPIAAGKTTLATLLARHLGSSAALILEDYEGNPFLSDFYGDPSRWALPMQLNFLLARRATFGRLENPLQEVVADHSLAKERVFAPLLLTERELALYERVAAALPEPETAPDLVVYLYAPVGELLKRIAQRGRPYESGIDAHYLESLTDAYAVQLALMPEQRVLRLDTSQIDLRDEAQMRGLWRRIVAEATSPSVERQQQPSLEIRSE